jgi:pimeloyl-ACP methyl ester carboxylesterase
MATLAHDGIELAYDVAGPESAPAVVFAHGLSGARSTWHDVVPAIAADHRVVTYDHRGHGGSSHAPDTYDIEHWAGDLVAILEQVVGEPAFLVGHSLGGVVAAQVIGDRPDLVRGAVLEDPPLFIGSAEVLASTPFGFVFPLMRDSFREMRARGATLDEYVVSTGSTPALNGAGTFLDLFGPQAIARQAQATKDLDPETMESAITGAALGGFDPSRPLPVPVLVLQAELFAAFRPEDEAFFLAANPTAVVELVPGASHLIHDELPALVAEKVRGFLVAQA